jgi:peptidoglycan/LPS O-acetylase OafA/YrhL
MTTSKNYRYIAAIDHLRAYAAILVLFYHSVQHISSKIPSIKQQGWPMNSNPLMTLIHEGHTGVALFIVLSGFIFTYGGFGKKINYLQFLRNRALRIYPLMMTMTVIGISVFPERFTISAFFCTVLPFQNTAVSLQLDSYTRMFWTIAVELQFYLIFPFLNGILTEKGLAMLLPVLAFTMTARIGAVLHSGNPREFSYWTILGRLDQFVIGMMFAAMVKHFTIENRRLRWGVPVGSIGLLLAIFIFNRLGGWPIVSPWKIIWPPIEGLLWGLIIVGYVSLLHGKKNLFSRLIASIGNISYSIYLTHYIILTLAVDHSLFFAWSYNLYLGQLLSTLIVILPTTIIVSFLCYHVIEKPFLELRQSYLEPFPIKNSVFNELINNS